jgi:hypothetical protein
MKLKAFLFTLPLALAAWYCRADVLTDWNIKSGEIITEAKIGTPPAIRIMAVVQTAAMHAVDETARASSDAAIAQAAIAAAHRTVLLKMLPAQQAQIETAYSTALNQIADATAKNAGIAIGERCATNLIAHRLDDGATAPETYRPRTSAGAYVPTTATAAPQWAQRKPWLLSSPAQFRPAAPPALDSAAWAREYNEVKNLGARNSTHRSTEQTDIARFWEYSLPAIYFGVARSVALQPGRDVARNARLFAAIAQAMDDAMIAVWDAKYHYNFWRPVTAIRNGDIDGHDGTAREAGWLPLLDAPLHPEYPSGHSILAATVGTIIKADMASGPMTTVSTSSPTAKGVTRQWNSMEEFVQEVSNARIYAGIHFRAATEAGMAMGRQVGGLAVNKVLRPTS